MIDYLYVFAGTFVIAIALFKREILVRKDSFRIVLVSSIALFLEALLIHFVEKDPNSSSGALLVPLLSLGLYRLCYRFFFRWFKHDPRDTYLNWSPGLAADRVFNIVYFGISTSLVLLAVAVMMKLSRAGF
jgi:hypothetical protein